MMKRILIALIAAFSMQIAFGQHFDYRGSWSGEIDVQGTKLGLVLHIGDFYTLDVPMQGAKNIPVRLDSATPTGIELTIPSLGAKYTGTPFKDTFVGTFTQNGMAFPLTLKRGEFKVMRPQTPAEPYPYETREVSFTNGEAVLAGTLSAPADFDKGSPILLMVTGSGGQNRDEELMEHKPFAVIADAFARNGIASLRYDDRGCFASTGKFAAATTDTLAADALAGVKWLRGQGYTKVGILGHSEGGTIAFMLGAEDGVDFIVSMAGMAENGEATLLAQTVRIAMEQGMSKEMAETFAVQNVEMSRVQGGVWMQRFLELDPAPYIAKVKCPTLVLNGESDLQVLYDRNIPIIKEMLPSATVRTYPGLNHLFQHCTTGAPTEYYNIEETISPEVLNDMILWIKGL